MTKKTFSSVPQRLPSSPTRHLARLTAAGAVSKKDMGKVMKELQARHGSSYDGKAASQLVQSLLN